MIRMWTAPVLPLVVLLALTACTGDGGNAPPGADPTAPADGALAQELEFIACMREQGVDMVDPIPGDTSGRSALRHEIDVNGKGSDPAFQTALDACTEFLPAPPPPEPATEDELTALREYAQCMRDNGVPDFPDPEPDGEFPAYWLRPGDTAAETAVEACAHILPADG